ncbi:adenylate/guanylate cyclase domain-containing protein [Paracoccaceae bacterium]|nr:adenylate/guanylate cyclase domain-containing protein [Paracoccaceae bacterium]
MSAEKIERKIAVIFATDIIGYSKHMETDESETVQNLRACEKILTKLFDEFDARLFNTGGDSFLAEFPSAVSAVECAVAFQEAIQERNKADETTVKLEFRIGLNSGDVIKEKGNLLGDGVNIAARLEALAQTNGITISKGVYDFVKGKTKFEFNDIGLQKVKQNEFYAYDIMLKNIQKRKVNTKSVSSQLILMLVCGLIIIIGTIGYFTTAKKTNDFKALNKKNAQKSSIPMVLVRPIRNLAASEKNDAIGIGLTESMISILSKYNGLEILSSNTSFHIGENNFTDLQLHEEYNVDYTVEGSLQVMGTASRLTVGLNDLEKDKVIWSDNFDFSLDDIFQIQDQIGNKILSTLQIDAVGGSQAISWAEELNDLETFTTALNWRSEWRKFSPSGYKNSERLLNVLEEKIPNTGVFYNFSAWQVFQKINFGISTNLEQDRQNLRKHIDNAIDVRGNAEDYALKALNEVFHLSKSCEIAKADSEKALTIGGGVDVYTILGSVYSACGDLVNGVKHTKSALALTPNDNGWFITSNLVADLYQLGRFQEIREVIGDKIDAVDMRKRLISIFAVLEFQAGNKDNAERLVKKAKAQGLNKELVRSWFNDSAVVENLISDLSAISKLD